MASENVCGNVSEIEFPDGEAITITVMENDMDMETCHLDPLITTLQSPLDSCNHSTALVQCEQKNSSTNLFLKTIEQFNVNKVGHLSIDTNSTYENNQVCDLLVSRNNSVNNIKVEQKCSIIDPDEKGKDQHSQEELLEIDPDQQGEDQQSQEELLELHCLVCNNTVLQDCQKDPVTVFKTLTSTTQRKICVVLSTLVGQKLTSRKAHSDILCRRCFGLIDKIDELEQQIKSTSEEIRILYEETEAVYHGRVQRRRKPASQGKQDFVFSKIEDTDVSSYVDEDFKPSNEDDFIDIIKEDHEEEGPDNNWEPQKCKIQRKRQTEPDPTGSPKRKRGRPRKDKTTISEPKNNVQWMMVKNLVESKEDSNSAACREDSKLQSSRTNVIMHEKNYKMKLNVYAKKYESTRKFSSSIKNCPECHIEFLTLPKLKSHFKIAHEDIKSIMCPHCEDILPSDLLSYLAHIDNAHDLQNVSSLRRLRECKGCSKYIKSSVYNQHLESHKHISCTICNALLLPHNLGRHINSCHTKKVSYQCPDCPALFHDSSNLLSHQKRNHLGQAARRHLCEICGKKFVSPSDLKTHVTGVHQNVKKFVCEFCGLSFKIASGLTYHRRHHTGERPHICYICGRGFIKPNSMAKHLRFVHRVEYYGKYRKRLKAQKQQEHRKILNKIDLKESIIKDNLEFSKHCEDLEFLLKNDGVIQMPKHIPLEPVNEDQVMHTVAFCSLTLDAETYPGSDS